MSSKPEAAAPRQVQPPGAERRRQLRKQRRQEFWRNSWRTFVLLAAASGLGWALLRQGWILRSPTQVEVVGSQQVSREQAIQAAGLRFPVPLLELSPQRIRTGLAAALPVENIQVTRLMLPPRLRIQLVDREAVARAERRSSAGLELGYVDRFGNWMSRRQRGGSGQAAPEPTLKVVGWQERHRPALARVLARRQSLGSTLQEIRFEPSGSLWLQTASLGRIRLGPPDGLLDRRLEVLEQLSKELPARVRSLKLQTIDLSDPDQPELGLPAPASGSGGELGAQPGRD